MVDMYQQGMYGPEGFYEEAMTPTTPQTGVWGFAAAIPGGPTMGMVNAGRMSRTMLYGARQPWTRRGRTTTGHQSYTRNALRNNNFFNPLAWGRYSTDEFLTTGTPRVAPHAGRRGARGVANVTRMVRGKELVPLDADVAGYNPLYFSRMANSVAGWAGRRVGEDTGGMRGRFRAASMAEDVPLFQAGFTGRLGAASRLNSMSARQFGRVQSAGSAFMTGIDAASASTGREAAARIMLSTGGYYTGRAAGFMQGAQEIRTHGWKPRIDALKGLDSTTDEAARGLQMAMDWHTKANVSIAQSGNKALLGKAGLRKSALFGARAAYTGSKVLAGPVGWAMLAYDMAKLTTKATYAVASTYTSAYKEATSGMTTRIGGGGFMDTQASATSRARGVAAIQNSRLNARSILGSEASMMAGAF